MQKTQQVSEFCYANAFSQEGIVEVAQAYDDIIVELENEDAVREFKPDINLLANIDCRGIIITARSVSKYDFLSRFFGPRVGVNEDPVTDSAHCKLAHYWMTKLQKNTLKAYQASSRGGEISIEVINDRVLLGGKQF